MQKYPSSPSSQFVQKQNSLPHTKMKWPNPLNKKTKLTPNKNLKTRALLANHFKRIIPSELSYRREKGLCFTCAKPYTLGHVCKQAHMHYIFVDEFVDPGDTHENQEDDVEVFCDYPEKELRNGNIEVSIHALARGIEHKTIKMKGNLAGKEVMILVDSGNTRFFIEERLAETLQLHVTGVPFTINVANGEKLESSQM